MYKFSWVPIISLILASALVACEHLHPKRKQDIYQAPAHYGNVSFPVHNPPDSLKVQLGQKLFFDPILSGSDGKSCASCHMPQKAFADSLQYSLGEEGAAFRNTPPLFNLAWADKGLFWDGGASSLEKQVFGSFESAVEMHQSLPFLIHELQEHQMYPALFEEAFGSDSITTWHLAKALAQFERSLVSAKAPYDRYLQGTCDMGNEAIRGEVLVKKHCGGCHSGVFFTDYAFHNNGLDSMWDDESQFFLVSGRFRISKDSGDMGAYKTPSLRNLAFTAPYMHDGRFSTIDEVLDHYSHGVKESPYLDDALRKENGSLGIPLKADERKAIITFLAHLNDTAFTQKQYR